MEQPAKPRVMCVDDETRIIEGLALHLRRNYEVFTATSGQAALQTLQQVGGVAVVISDMRMPGMDGAGLLKQVMRRYPETSRILLTGEPGRDAAVSAVNEGQIFRFLTKPCAPEQLLQSVDAAVIQYRLMTAEKRLLQETLIGCIKALIDVLAITNPVAFGRTKRVARLTNELSAALGSKGFWQLEAAAMLSQMGCISLPPELVEKLYYGERLTAEEKTLSEGAPQVAHNLLGHIPRLEPVLQILSATGRAPTTGSEGMVQHGANILRVALDYDALIAQGHSPSVAIQTLRNKSGAYDATILTQLANHLGTSGGSQEVREIPLRLVRPGMVFLDDVRTHMGTLLVPKGFEVTEAFLERTRNFGSGIMGEQVRVMVDGGRGEGESGG